MQNLTKGTLIAIEGTDGSGKSTLARRLHELLAKHQFPTVLTKEFGGTPLGKKIREMLHQRTVPMSNKAEYLLIAADRAQHSAEVVMPSLEKNMLVISDRMGDSSLVYQGHARGLDMNMIRAVNFWAMNNKTPDLTLYVRLDLETAMDRVKTRNKRLTDFEKESTAFFERVINGYDSLYHERDDVIILDGILPPEELAQKAYTEVLQWLENNESEK
ncbi:dTMP kinase [Candidatus Babeliales bacterium]|nr:dTMP kinase [Candidatus Babeliales bacterium]